MKKVWWIVIGIVIVVVVLVGTSFMTGGNGKDEESEFKTNYDYFNDYELDECESHFCVISVALRAKDVSICEEILKLNKPALEGLRYQCVLELAVELNDPSLCENIGTENEDGENFLQSDCYLQLAEKTKNPSLCDLMTSRVGNSDAFYCRQGLEVAE